MPNNRVLVADDNVELAETVADILADDGFDVAVVSSGTQALITWRKRPSDLVVLDVDLPDIDGLTIARRLSRRPQGCGLVVMSARDPEVLVPRCDELGARFLPKPFGPTHLLDAVRAMLEERIRRAASASQRIALRLLGPRTPRALLDQFRRR